MSHIVEARTSIKHPNLDLLRRAVETVVARHQGRLQPFYLDYYGGKHAVASGLAIFTPKLSRGIGVGVNSDGELTFVGDPFEVQALYEQVQGDVVQGYTCLALMLAMEKLRFVNVQALEGQEKHIVVTGITAQRASYG